MRIKSHISGIAVLILINLCVINAQDFNKLKRIAVFANETSGWLEGYTRSTGGNDFTYHSFRNDLVECMLTRCTSGTMPVEWETQAAENFSKAGGAGFIWIAALDLTTEDHSFSIFINGIKRFTLKSSLKDNWIVENEEGGKLRFFGVEKDQNGDAHGYMTLWAPASWLTPGKPLSVRITGGAEKSQCWIIIYKCTDALSYLQNSVKYNMWAEIEIDNSGKSAILNISMPVSYRGKELKLKTGDRIQNITTDKAGEKTFCEVILDSKLPDGTPLSLSDELGEIVHVNSVSEEGRSSGLAYNFILVSNVQRDRENIVKIKSTRSYYPKTVESLIKLAQSNLGPGRIYLMNSSHQDIAWMDSPEKCVIERDTMLLTPLFSKAMRDPSYRFDIEDVLMIREYVHRHPEKKEMIRQLLKNGQISCGSSFIQPYEEMYSGESLVRQFYLGAKWMKKEFDYSPDTYWNPDVPGRTLQMPQILMKSGTRYMSVSRMEAGIYKWYSPDGSFVTAYSPGHYSYAYGGLQKEFFEAAEFIAKSSLAWNRLYNKPSENNLVPLLSDWDMSPGVDYSGLIGRWNGLNTIQNAEGKYIPLRLPQIVMSLTPDLIKGIEKSAVNIPVIKGERPAVWLYIHGPTHHKAITASREADILLTVAEKFSTACAMINHSFSNYPEKELDNAWESKIYPDHGWGGKHGDITDALFQEKYYFSKAAAEKIIESSLREISSNIKVNPAKGIAIEVFNSLSWIRDDPASFSISLSKAEAMSIELSDAAGNRVPVQLTSVVYNDDNSIKSAVVHFIAEKVPSVGYKTYYLKTSGKAGQANAATLQRSFENDFYKIEFSEGGLSSVFDKESGKEIINTSKFNAGEVFTMHSEGTGAGEFSDIQQPDMQGFDRAANYRSEWKITGSGDVFTCFLNRQPVRNTILEQRILIYNKLKRIDFIIDLLNYEGVLYREYRMAMPLNMENGNVSYEVPFGVLSVGRDEIGGAAGERYTTVCRDIHPRGIENWIGASNSEFGVTLSSSVAVADYVDPTGNPSKNTVLQPILLASRRSCHGEGNEYLQTGDHHYEFSFTSHGPGWENGYRFGRQANEKLIVITGSKPFANADLTEELSFFSFDNNDRNLVISAIKKSSDDNSVVVRFFDISGRETTAKLKFFKPFESATMANLIEEPVNPVRVSNRSSVSLKTGKYSIETVILK